MRTALTVLTLLAVASCVSPTPAPVAPPAPAPRYVPPPTPALRPVPLVSDWRDWPQTPGDWRYAGGGFGRSTATFGGGAGGGFALQLACDSRARTVTLSVTGAPGEAPLTVRTSSLTRSVPVQTVAHADAFPPITQDARLPTTDPLLDAIAFTRGRFTVEQPGQPPLVLPAWAEVGRVIEDCRG